jgi:Iap family predicted aminopeptidase
MKFAFIAALVGLHAGAFAAESLRNGPPQTLNAELKPDRVVITVGEVRPPHSPTPIPVPSVHGAAGAQANS